MRSLANFLSPKASKAPFTTTFRSADTTPQNVRKDENYNIDVLCTNCQEMINVNEIDKHSMICCKVSEKVFQIENNLSVDQIEYKLSKLREALEQHINQRRNSNDARNEENHAREIISYINQILYFERRSDLKKIKSLKDLLSIIQSKLEDFRGSTSLLLYLERVKLLGKEKYRELIKQDQESISNWKEQINFGTSSSSNNFTPSTSSSINSGHANNLMADANARSYPVGQGLKSPTNLYTQNHNTYSQSPFYQSADAKRGSESPRFQNPQRPTLGPTTSYPSNIGQSPTNFMQSPTNFMQTQSKERDINSYQSYQSRNIMTVQPVEGRRVGSPQIRMATDYTSDYSSQKQPLSAMPRSESNKNLSSPTFYSSNSPFQPFDISRKTRQDNVMPYQIGAKSSVNQFGDTNTYSQSTYNQTRQVNNPFERSSPTQRFLNQSPESDYYSSRQNTDDYYDTQPRESQGIIKQQLETKLQSSKKEYSQITQLVDTYKKKTESIQSSMNIAHYGTTNPRHLSSNPSLRDSQTSFDMNPKSSSQLTNRENYNRGAMNSISDRRGNQTDNQIIKLRNNMIEDIDSDYERRGLSSKYSESQETSSNIDRSTGRGNRPVEDFGFEDIDQNFELQAMQDAAQEEQRLFYSKCLAIKLRFRTQDLAQLVPVALVYKDAIQKSIPEKGWDAFIENAFLHPEKYIDLKKLQKKKKHGLKNNLAEIAKTKVIPKRNRDNFHNIDVIYE